MMALPLPADPDFRKVCVGFWLDDVDDRLDMGRSDDAEISWKEANAIYLSLPAGSGDPELEDRLYSQRVKLNNLTYITNENNL
jgi:hypothetical protein